MRLRNLLLAWLLLPSLALWGIGFWLSYLHVLGESHEAFDRTLLGSAQVVGERLTVEAGEVLAQLPPAALEMLRTDAHDRIFYRVLDPERGHVTGYASLPPPPPGTTGDVAFYDAEHGGDAVRVAALRVSVLDGERTRPLWVLVAETLEARRELAQSQMALVAAAQLALLALAAGLIALGVRRGLMPLRRLRAEVRGRDADDLTPIGTREVPREVVPLIHAINEHMRRQRQLSELQLRFVADASHQLKTPLTSLRTQIDHAMRQRDLDAMCAALARLHESALSTQRMVTQLLSQARSDQSLVIDKQPLDLVGWTRAAVFDLLALARSSGVDLGFEGEGRLSVQADPVLLREAVSNLVHNAIVYTAAAGPGGVVTVSVRDDPRGPLLEVVDNGPGIPADERQRVLERFYRRPGSAGSGSGLGLSIVKDLCSRHGIELDLLDGPDGRGLRAVMRWANRR